MTRYNMTLYTIPRKSCTKTRKNKRGKEQSNKGRSKGINAESNTGIKKGRDTGTKERRNSVAKTCIDTGPKTGANARAK